MYRIIFQKPAELFFRRLDKKEQEIISKKIVNLSDNPQLGKPLIGKLAGLWSLRIGKYRAIYQIRRNELIILILKIGHRKNIYS
ncbi:type II toxin-antitoxin system RelE/ParE family toxin [Candidatus Pacearchaeota archaeon]|nr:type II toxin-antitoxin system RelE/ParE family toxin [Candidatus Pacearchaeota archaeon]